MEKYYVSIRPQTDEIHSIHKEGCPFMPDSGKRIYLGMFNSVNDAGAESRKYFSNSCSCRFCLKESAGRKVSEPAFNLMAASLKSGIPGIMLQYIN